MSDTTTFTPFNKIPRYSREAIFTEKLDGTNSSIFIDESGLFLTGSRNRWITPSDDNYGFSRWAHEHKSELMTLGPGHHFGEWWGAGIQRRYGLTEKRFSLFNVLRWEKEIVPPCCSLVPVILRAEFCSESVDVAMGVLQKQGSLAAPGFMNPEGIIICHIPSRTLFKKTFDKDEAGKGE